MLKSIADLKRALHVNAEADIENLRYPHLSGRRQVLKAQTQRWCFSFPEGHAKAGDPHGSWLDIPKCSEVTFEGSTATLLRDDTGEPWLRITVTDHVT